MGGGELADEKRQHGGGAGKSLGKIEQNSVGASQKEISFKMLSSELTFCRRLVDHRTQVNIKKAIVKKRRP